MNLVFKFLLILLTITIRISADCGCSKTTREERAKKYERSEDSRTDETEIENTKRWTNAKVFESMALIPSGKYFIGTDEQVFGKSI